MSGFLKMSAFRRFTRLADNDNVICIINGVNAKINWSDLKKLLDIAPIDFFGGDVSPTDNFEDLEDGLYIPDGDGVYNGVIVNNTNSAGAEFMQGITLLVWSNGVLKKIEFPVNIRVIGLVQANDVNAVSGGEVFRKVPTLDDLGVVRVAANQNVIQDYTNGSNTNVSIFDISTFYHKTLGTKQVGGDFIASKDKIPVAGGVEYDYNFYLYGNSGVVFYNSIGTVVQSVSTTVPTAITQVSGSILLDNSVVSMGFSHAKARALSLVFFRAKSSKTIATSKIFSTIAHTQIRVDEKYSQLKNELGFNLDLSKFKDKPFLTYESFEKFGFQIFNSGENMFPFLDPVDLNSDIWADGFLRNNGTITVDASWKHSLLFFKLPGGSYTTNLYYAGNSYLWVVDRNGVMLRALQGGTSSGAGSWSFNIDEENGEYGVKIAVTATMVGNGIDFYLRPNQDVYISPVQEREPGDDTSIKPFIKEVISKKNPTKRIQPIITFISDDGAIENDWFIDALNLYNWKATFAIITGRFGDTHPGFYTKQQIVDNLLNKGHEVAGHTVTHNASAQLGTLTEDQLHQEIGRCKFDLLSVDNRIKPVNFVSPFGSRNTAVDRVVRQYFEANYVTRADSDISTGAAINYPPIDNFFMKRVSFDANSPTSGALDVSRIEISKQAVDKVVADGGWLIFAIHPHYAQYLNDANTVDSKQELIDLLAYIYGLNIPVMTAEQARSHYKNTSIGNYRLDTDFYERGSNGSEVGTYLNI